MLLLRGDEDGQRTSFLITAVDAQGIRAVGPECAARVRVISLLGKECAGVHPTVSLAP